MLAFIRGMLYSKCQIVKHIKYIYIHGGFYYEGKSCIGLLRWS